MIGRSVSEWHGATPDARIPTHVKLRILERCGNRCWITGKELAPGDEWDFDHVIALCNGGTHSEFNLAPALRAAHRQKSAADVAERAKVDRLRVAHLGLKQPSRPMAGSKRSPWKHTFRNGWERRNG